MMMLRTRNLVFLMGMLLLAGLAHAGGGEESIRKSSYRPAPAPVTATPEQTAAAVARAREAVAPKAVQAPAPVPRTVVIPESRPVATAPARRPSPPVAASDAWMLSAASGQCSPLSSLPQQAAKLGTVESPQQMAKSARQRGYQSFLLDLSDAAGESFRVKVPDLDLNLLFVRPAACR